MELSLKPDFDKSKERYDAFWERNHRPSTNKYNAAG